MKSLNREAHVKCLKNVYEAKLPSEFFSLMSSQTWAAYWVNHSLAVLGEQIFIDTVVDDVQQFICDCKHPDGGYGGGPGQIAHIATTFASVNAIIALCSTKALESIDRLGIYNFFKRMKQPNGSFTMHDDGESDSRAVYCVLAVMKNLCIDDNKLMQNVVDWVLSCQTYEGGFSSVPGSEAHGGYTFCCVASLLMLQSLDKADISSLLRWLTNRQMKVEGGFNGRSNKLVDSCYSYWQGASFVMLHNFLATNDKDYKVNKHLEEDFLFDANALHRYILNECQDPGGLLCDKPGTEGDFYHTCYSLSGLSMTQILPDQSSRLSDDDAKCRKLVEIHPIFNLTHDALRLSQKFFKTRRLCRKLSKV